MLFAPCELQTRYFDFQGTVHSEMVKHLNFVVVISFLLGIGEFCATLEPFLMMALILRENDTSVSPLTILQYILLYNHSKQLPAEVRKARNIE